MKRRALFATAVAAAAAGFLTGPMLWQWIATDSAWMDESAFDDLDGHRRRLAEWRERPLVVNFWATWCAPCREEIPLLIAARQRHGARGLEVLGIAIDLLANAREYAKRMAMTYPVLVADAAGLELMRRLGNRAGALPYTVFVSRRGEVTRRKLGPLTAAELQESVTQLLE